MNWKKTLNRTIEYVFCGITAIQTVLGTIWVFCQFPHMQNWQESYEYLEISQTWLMDEYVSFLYPLLLRMCTSIESVSGIPFYMPVYVLQLAVAVLASWYFVRTVLQLEKRKTIWAAGYLVSFPLLLQFHMSVRVESLCVSGVLVLIAYFRSLKTESVTDRKRAGIRSAVGALLVTALLIWLLPDMAVICGVLWSLCLLECIIKTRKKTDAGRGEKSVAVFFITFVLALTLGLSVNALVQAPGSRGKIQKSFWSAAFQRVVTDYYSKSFGMWDEDVKALMNIDEALGYTKRSDQMIYEIGPMLESAYGREHADELYKSMTLTCFRLRTRMVVYQIRDDLIDGALMPFSVWWQDNGERLSQTGWNYGRFRENAPNITPVYLEFGVCSLLVLCVLGVASCVINKKRITGGLYILLAAAVQWFFYVLSTGERVDYSSLLFVIVGWCFFAVSTTICKEKDYAL